MATRWKKITAMAFSSRLKAMVAKNMQDDNAEPADQMTVDEKLP
jgi:hypothetical protein